MPGVLKLSQPIAPPHWRVGEPIVATGETSLESTGLYDLKPCRPPRRGSARPRNTPVQSAFGRKSFLGKFLLLSIGLHLVLFAGIALFLAGFHGPELSLAQGAMSLEIISATSGQEGIAAMPGEGVAAGKKSKPTAHPVETKTVAQEVKSEPTPSKKQDEGAADVLDELSEVTESDSAPKSVSEKVNAPRVAAAKPSAEPVGAAASDNGHGQKAAQTGSSTPGVYQPGTPGGEAPSTVSNPTPRYPEAARKQGVEGAVVLRLNIDVTGRVRQATVVKSSGRGDFDHAAVETIESRWRYRPARSWGKPVESSEVVRVCFVLGEA